MKQVITLFIITIATIVSCKKKDPTSDDNIGAEAAQNSRTKSATGAREPSRAKAPGNKLAKRTVEGEFEHTLELALAIETTEEREKQIAELAWKMLEARPDLTEIAIRRLPESSPERPGLIEAYLLHLVQQDPQLAIKWADSLGSPNEIVDARRHIALSLSEDQIGQAVEILLNPKRLAVDGFDNAANRIFEKWVTKAPVQAAEWINNLPPGASRDSAIGIIAGQWIHSNPAEAFGWVASIKNEELRTEIVRSMAQVVSEMPEELRDLIQPAADEAIASEFDDAMRKLQSTRDSATTPESPAPEGLNSETEHGEPEPEAGNEDGGNE